jgi:hypothetical protein
MMPIHRKRLMLAAWLDERVVAGITRWLNNHPAMDQTAFLVTAAVEKLKSSNIQLPPEAVLNATIRKWTSRDHAKSDATRTIGAAGAGRATRGQIAKARKSKKPATRRGNTVLVRARMDEIVVGGIEIWLALRPGFSRTDFLLEAVVAKLKKHGITTPEHTAAGRQRRPLGPGAYSGIDDSGAVTTQLAELTKNMENFLKRRNTDQLFPQIKAAREMDRKNEPMAEEARRHLEQAKLHALSNIEELAKLVAQIDKILQSTR